MRDTKTALAQQRAGGVPQAPGRGAKFYEARPGYANYFFNRQERDRLLSAFLKHGDFGKVAGNWNIEVHVRVLRVNLPDKFKIQISEEKDGAGSTTVVKGTIGAAPYALDPPKSTSAAHRLQ